MSRHQKLSGAQQDCSSWHKCVTIFQNCVAMPNSFVSDRFQIVAAPFAALASLLEVISRGHHDEMQRRPWSVHTSSSSCGCPCPQGNLSYGLYPPHNRTKPGTGNSVTPIAIRHEGCTSMNSFSGNPLTTTVNLQEEK